MAPPVTREWSITYGSITVGGSSDFYLLVNKFTHLPGYERVRVAFEVLVIADTESAFVSRCQALEDELRKPRLRLTIVHGAETFRDYNPATNTGFDAVAESNKPGSRADTGRSRLYRCTVVIKLPSDGTDGEGNDLLGRSLDAGYKIEYEDNRRRNVTFTGGYTAIGGNSALEQYEQEIGVYTTDILSEISATAVWQLIGTESNDVNDTNKEMRYTRIFREITLDQAEGVVDQASVVRQSFKMSRAESGSSDTFIRGRVAKPFLQYRVEYEAVIDQTVTPAADLDTLWENVLRPHVLDQVQKQLGVGIDTGAVMIEDYRPDPENNIIAATIQYKTLNGSLVVKSSMRKACSDQSGLSFTPVTTGRKFEYDIDNGPPSRELRVTVDETIAGGQFYEYTPPQNFHFVSRTPELEETTEGNTPNTITTKRRVTTWTYRFAIEYSGGGSAGGGSNGGGNSGNTTVLRNPLPNGAAGSGGGATTTVRDGGGNSFDVCAVSDLTGDGL